jgi:hypothetical protein
MVNEKNDVERAAPRGRGEAEKEEEEKELIPFNYITMEVITAQSNSN